MDHEPFAGMAQEATLEAMFHELAFRLSQLAGILGCFSPDAAGCLRVNVEAGATIAAVTTVTTLANQTSVGGYAAALQGPSIALLAEGDLRRNIAIS